MEKLVGEIIVLFTEISEFENRENTKLLNIFSKILTIVTRIEGAEYLGFYSNHLSSSIIFRVTIERLMEGVNFGVVQKKSLNIDKNHYK